MSTEHRNLVEKLARHLSREAGTDALGDAFEEHGLHQDGSPINAEGFLDLHRNMVRIVLAELRSMGKLK